MPCRRTVHSSPGSTTALDRERNGPFDLDLKRYGRIGCRLDLPLFHYRELLDSAVVTINDGKWDGRRVRWRQSPCRQAAPAWALAPCSPLPHGLTSTTSFRARRFFSIDNDRRVPLHETLTSSREKDRSKSISQDYVEIEPGQWAPLSIRIEWKDYFTCQYTFQVVGGKHWMLREVVSWFKPEDKSRGVIEDVRIDGDRARLDDALRQVEAAKKLFSGSNNEPQQHVQVGTVPFRLGDADVPGPVRDSGGDAGTLDGFGDRVNTRANRFR